MQSPKQYVKYPIEDCPVSLFAAELAEFSSEQLAQKKIVLPNKRLEVAISREITSRKDASFFPGTYSIDELLENLIEENVDLISQSLPNEKLIDQLTEEMLLKNLIASNEFKFLSIGHEHEICVFNNSLIMNKQEDEWYVKACQAVERDQAKSDASLELISERLSETKKLLELYKEYLSVNGLMTMAQKTSKLVELAELIPFESVESCDLYFFGFTTVQPIYKTFLRKLTESNNFYVRLSEQPNLFSKENPIADLHKSLIAESFVKNVTTHRPTGDVRKNITVIKNQSVFDEVYNALGLAEEAIKGGVSPSRIGIFVTDERSYAPLFRDMSKSFDFETNIALPLTLADTFVGDFFRSLRNFYHSNGTANDLHILINCDLIWSVVKENISEYFELNFASKSENMLREYVCLNLNECDLTTNIFEMSENNFVSSVLALLKEQLDYFFQEPSERPATATVDQMKSCLMKLVGGLSKDFIEADLYASICSSVEKLCDSLTILTSDRPLTLDEFFDHCVEKLSLVAVRGVGYPLKGVQITSVIESRYIPYEVVIVCGCLEGDFPKSLPQDVVVDNFFKMMIGLPSWSYVEAMEDTTFNLLWKRIPNLYLSYPELKSSTPTVRSRFIDRVIIDQQDVIELVGRKYSTGEVDKSEFEDFSEPQIEELGGINSDLAAFFKKMSPTALEALVKCPYKYYLSKLRLRKIDAIQDQRALLQGNWIHLVIEKFFQGIGSEEITPLADLNEPSEDYLVERITQIADILFDKEKIDYPNFYQLKAKSFPSFVRWYKGLILSEGKEIKHLNEYDISSLRVKMPNEQGFDIELRGVIDSLIQMRELTLFLDYKTSSTPSAKDVGRGLNPQLLLYAYAAHSAKIFNDHGMEKFVLGYWSVLNSKYDLSSFGSEAPASRYLKVGPKARKPEISDALQNVYRLFNWRLKLIDENKRFAPDVGKACDFCDFESICRKNDPAWRDVISENSQLEKKLKET